MPKLKALKMPTLMLYGDQDFIPREISEHIAAAIPHARLITLAACGHFAYLECAAGVRSAFADFFRGAPR